MLPVIFQKPVLITLCSLVENFKNYKVRIQACSALCGLPSREIYGQEYISVWRALFNGLDNSRNISDYHEIRHRDELIHQVSVGEIFSDYQTDLSTLSGFNLHCIKQLVVEI